LVVAIGFLSKVVEWLMGTEVVLRLVYVCVAVVPPTVVTYGAGVDVRVTGFWLPSTVMWVTGGGVTVISVPWTTEVTVSIREVTTSAWDVEMAAGALVGLVLWLVM
jgi:hypothetical protein